MMALELMLLRVVVVLAVGYGGGAAVVLVCCRHAADTHDGAVSAQGFGCAGIGAAAVVVALAVGCGGCRAGSLGAMPRRVRTP